MKALRFDGQLALVDVAAPQKEGEALIQVLRAGICSTDLEITKGYGGFHGVLGHEFVGRVVESPDPALIGQRVVGEINVGCDRCGLCRTGDSRHCAGRTVLGIHGRDGAFAEYLSLPPRNLIVLPETISNDSAVFVEPLAAAVHILDAAPISSSMNVVVIGDGKLAQLIIRILAHTGCALTVVGKHAEKIARSSDVALTFVPAKDVLLDDADGMKASADLVVEASGSPTGFPLALRLVRPRGVVILKTTHHGPTAVELFPVVVVEVTIIGSRCGRFAPAIDLLESRAVEVDSLISERFPIEDGLRAFERAGEPDSLKVILDFAD